MTIAHPTINHNNRIGFQFFPDTIHYRESDLIAWLPELVAMGANWLVLDTPSDRAIPEDFLKPLISAGIEPILNMQLPIYSPPTAADLSVLFEVYSSWGVRYISLFDRPNTLQAWTEESWMQHQLVDRFLEIFIPLAELICEKGMAPIFPPLEPGGNFWDTAFLRSSLQGIKTRQHTRLLDHLVLGAYAWPNQHHLNWGAGGPEKWPAVRPYDTPAGDEDQQGFRIFDWYTAISETILGKKLPILLMGTGAPAENHLSKKTQNTYPQDPTAINLQIAKILAREITAFITPETPQPIPDHVLAGCFSHLVSSPSQPDGLSTWYLPDGNVLPIVQKIKDWHTSRKLKLVENTNLEETIRSSTAETKSIKPIKHYMLLPRYEWGVASWYLEVSQPYIQKHTPTIGFSTREAFLAERVTLVGGIHAYPDQLVHELEKNGSTVVQISGNGTDIATQLTIK